MIAGNGEPVSPFQQPAQPSQPLTPTSPGGEGPWASEPQYSLGATGSAPWFNARRFITSLIVAVGVCAAVFVGGLALVDASGSTAALQATSDEIDAQIETNGDVSVTELVTIQMRKRDSGPYHQLFRTIKLDSTKVTDVSDVSVTRILSNSSTSYTRSDFALPDYSDTTWDSRFAGHWYLYDQTNDRDYLPVTDALTVSQPDDTNDSKQLEFGWNIPSTESGTMTFRLTYTLRNLATEYSDVSETFWELVSADESMPIKKLTATVSLPQGANTSNTWAWLHTEAKSSTHRDDDGTLHFEVDNVETSDYVDAIVLTDDSMMSGVARVSPQDRKDYRISVETEAERRWHQNQVAAARRNVVLIVLFALAGLAIIVWAVWGAFRSYRGSQPWLAGEYWHEPPAMSPAAAARMNHVIDATQDEASCELSSTLLSLASKHCLVLAPGPARWYEGIDLAHSGPSQYRSYIQGVASANGKPGTMRKSVTTTVCLLVNTQHGGDLSGYNLCRSERQLLTVFSLVADRLGTPTFDMDQMSEQWQTWTKGITAMEQFKQECSQEFTQLEATKAQFAWHGLPAVAGGLYLFFIYLAWQFGTLSSLWPLLCVAAVLVMAAVLFTLAYGKSVGITAKGQHWAEQVYGFKKYLLDFSHFQTRGIEDLVLWDRYLVYAAAFGISEQVLRQLYLAEPRLQDISWVDSHTNNSLLYWYVAPRARDMSAAAADPTMTSVMNFGGLDDFADSLSASLGTVRDSFSTAFSDLHSASSGSSSFGGIGGSFGGGGFGGGGGGGGGGGFGGR